ncbi:hypothetical protein Ae201684_015279 [Aphanomyces euteiches]|uniref:Uncharacterized protein n=1 Tax=Aphanomyces euteiches TaxID=100861 RepID=A0A6G0WH46_9STRA|nr:hypothetical protein Ae201684_015279 [Aphanomyces euteiches]
MAPRKRSIYRWTWLRRPPQDSQVKLLFIHAIAVHFSTFWRFAQLMCGFGLWIRFPAASISIAMLMAASIYSSA